MATADMDIPFSALMLLVGRQEQGSHTWKVLDFFLENSRTWKVLKITLVLESPGN